MDRKLNGQPAVTVIGAGPAGSECAWQLAKRGIRVRLMEMKPKKMTPAQLLKADNIADYYTYEPILDENKRVVVEPFISMTESHAKSMTAAGVKSAVTTARAAGILSPGKSVSDFQTMTWEPFSSTFLNTSLPAAKLWMCSPPMDFHSASPVAMTFVWMSSVMTAGALART